MPSNDGAHLMCAIAAGLIALCVGYLPPDGSSVEVKRSCISSFSIKVRRAAVKCAKKHHISYRVH